MRYRYGPRPLLRVGLRRRRCRGALPLSPGDLRSSSGERGECLPAQILLTLQSNEALLLAGPLEQCGGIGQLGPTVEVEVEPRLARGDGAEMDLPSSAGKGHGLPHVD